MATLLLGFGVLIGAFGAHGLKTRIDPIGMSTYQTGVEYYFYHALALLLYGISMKAFHLKAKASTAILFLIGISLFSGCCFLYALTGNKTFAMIVPIGGISFVLAWSKFFLDLRNVETT